MRIHYLFFLVFLTFLTAHAALAQQAAVKGKVTSRETGEGLPGVSISVKGTTTGTASAPGALGLVNQVRARSQAGSLSTLTLKDLEEERAREFIWEGHRRRDMIRFGTYFTGTWQFKTNITPVWKGIYPIPSQQIIANPKLVQNPNY